MNRVPPAIPYPPHAVRQAHRGPARDWNNLPLMPSEAMVDRWLHERPYTPTAEDLRVITSLLADLAERARHGEPFARWLLNEVERAKAVIEAART